MTVRQASYRGHAGQGFLGGFGGGHDAPMLRTMSVKAEEKSQIGDHLALEYGGLVEAVAFLDRLTIVSPHLHESALTLACWAVSWLPMHQAQHRHLF